MKKLPTIVLVLLGLAIALPGVVCLFAPGTFAGPLFSGALGVDSANELRAIGGTRLGIAIVLFVTAAVPTWRRSGLSIGGAVFGCTLFGRLLATGLDGVPGAMLKPEIAEAVLLALTILALRTTKTTSRVGDASPV